MKLTKEQNLDLMLIQTKENRKSKKLCVEEVILIAKYSLLALIRDFGEKILKQLAEEKAGATDA